MVGKDFKTEVLITGSTDRSLGKAVAETQKFISQLNKSFKNVSNSANGLPPTLQKSVNQMERMNRQSGKLEESMRRISEIAIGVSLAEGFKKAYEFTEKIADKLKEFTIGSLEVHAGREVLTNQMHSMLESMGRGGMEQSIYSLARQMEGKETSQNFNQLLGTSTRLLQAAPERFKDIEQIHHMLGELADVSKDSATYDLATASITKMLAEGRVDAKHLQEFAVDTGFNLTRPMAQALGMTPEELAQALKKHSISGDKQVDALLKAMDYLTSPGGPAFGHAKAQLQGLEGLYRRWEATWIEFQNSFGSALEDFLKPIADDVLTLLNPNDVSKTFNWLRDTMSDLGHDAKALFDTVKSVDLSSVGKSFQVQVAKVREYLDQFFTEFHNPVTGDIDKVLKPTDVVVNLMNRITTASGEMAGKLGGLVDGFNSLSAAFSPVINFLNWLDSILYGRLVPIMIDIITMDVGKLRKDLGLASSSPLPATAPHSLYSNYNPSAFPDTPAMRDYIAKHQQEADAANKSAEVTIKSSEATKKVSESLQNLQTTVDALMKRCIGL